VFVTQQNDMPLNTTEASTFPEIPLRPSARPPHHRGGELFVRGPLPWSWVVQAARLPGKALHIALVLWLLAGLRRTRTVTLGSKHLRDCGIQRHTAYRALRALELANLVGVERARGRGPIVTILAAPTDAAAGGAAHD
jgi:hypothetical protein